MAEEFFDGLEFGVGHIQVFFGVLRVLLLHEKLRFGEVRLHALLGGDNVATKAVARGGLLALQIIQRLESGSRAAVEIIVFLLDFFGLRSGLGLGLRGWCRVPADDRWLSGVLRLRSRLGILLSLAR